MSLQSTTRFGITVCILLSAGFSPSSSAADTHGPLGFGQEKHSSELESDRPDFTEGATPVTPGHLQLEGGYGFSYQDDSGEEIESHFLPQLLLRVGLIEDLELRLAWEGYVYESRELVGSEDQVSEGGDDISVGIKHKMYSEDGWLPDLSFIVELGIPSGANAVRADDVEPELKLIWGYELPCDFSLAGNLNFAGPVDDDERFFETSASSALGHSLSDAVGAYVEYFGFYPNADAPDSSSRNFLNGGFTYAVSADLQLDVYAGFGLNDAADDFFTGLGFVFRI